MVRPAKAGEFSRGSNLSGQKPEPCSSDGREERNRCSEAHRQRCPNGTSARPRAVTKVNANVASKLETPRVEPFLVGRRSKEGARAGRCAPSPWRGISDGT